MSKQIVTLTHTFSDCCDEIGLNFGEYHTDFLKYCDWKYHGGYEADFDFPDGIFEKLNMKYYYMDVIEPLYYEHIMEVVYPVETDKLKESRLNQN